MNPNVSNKNDNKDDEDEDDYMSDKFILETSSSKSSLLFTHQQRYEHQRHKRKLVSNPKSKISMKEIENQHREEGLAKPLNPENKGFKLLQKMMSSSSKSNSPNVKISNSESDIEKLVSLRKPIDIELKIGRQGLGHETKRPKLDKNKLPEKDLKINQDNFIKYNIEKSELHFTKKDYFQLQKTCLNLDSKYNIDSPAQQWYWPKTFFEDLKNKTKSNTDDDDDDSVDNEKSTAEDADDSEKEEEEIDFKSRLIELNNYIRNNYFFCIWCGCQFESLNDLQQNCPGNSRNLH